MRSMQSDHTHRLAHQVISFPALDPSGQRHGMALRELQCNSKERAAFPAARAQGPGRSRAGGTPVMRSMQ